jgi:peptide-methionine (S)-S-oxide reductase
MHVLHLRSGHVAGATALSLVVAVFSSLGGLSAFAADLDRRVPAPIIDEAPGASRSETLILAGGCFWGVQGVFQHVKGVAQAVSGYDGGKAKTAYYEIVSTGTTGHAESVRITYDPHVITYGKLLQIFFSVTTDPTQINQQDPDAGPQYRSEIFATTLEQAHIAAAYITQLDEAHVYAAPIATKIGQDSGFFSAEAYHQNFLTIHPDSLYIATYDLPKIGALQRVFPAEFQADPVLVRTVKGS